METCGVLAFCALLSTLQFHDATAWSFKPATLPMMPKFFGSVLSTTVMCQADTALVKCHVNMYTLEHPHDFVDLSLGSNSGSISRYHETTGDVPVYNVTYHGTGLENGQCGAVYSLAAPMSFDFGCRGMNAAGEWQDAHLVLANTPEAVPATISPLKAIAKPGDDVSLLLHSGVMLYCIAYKNLRSKQIVLYPDVIQDDAETFRYFGAGVDRGDCGVTLLNVSEIDNGPLSIVSVPSDKVMAKLVSILIIAAPPVEVSLNVDKLTYSEGDTLTATCSSLLSRPVANLTWTLDDMIIRQDAKRDGGEDEVWRWSWEKQNITQTMSLTLEPEHFGKKLECRVQHLDNVVTNSDYVIKHV